MGRKTTFRREKVIRGLTYRRCKKLIEELESHVEACENEHLTDKADSVRYCINRINWAMYETFKEQEEIPEQKFVPPNYYYGWICPVCGKW